jgi:hypothetical protein
MLTYVPTHVTHPLHHLRNSYFGLFEKVQQFQWSEEENFVGAAADYALLFLYYSALLMCYVLYLCFTGRSEKEAFIVGGMSRSEGGRETRRSERGNA